MANIKSQIKRNRQSEGRRLRNKSVRSFLKTEAKRFTAALDQRDLEGAERSYRAAAQAFDKAASKGVVHKNKAANKKSQLAKRLRQAAGS
jgi:small subunit ribosomal protein S20